MGWYASYHNMINENYSDYFGFDDFQPAGEGLQYYGDGTFYFDVTDSIWYNITLRIVINTFTGETPNYDGIFEAFVNGKLLDQVSGLYLITLPNINKGIDEMWFNCSFGGPDGPDRDEWLLFDDIVIFTYDESVEDIPRGNELSSPGRVLNLPGDHKWEY